MKSEKYRYCEFDIFIHFDGSDIMEVKEIVCWKLIGLFLCLDAGECHMLGSFSYASSEGEILGNYSSSKKW